MSTFNRILVWILIVISVFGILICSLGIVGSWMINDPVTREVLGLLSRAGTALSRVEDSLTLADAQLEDASAAVATVQEALTKMGDRVEKNSPVLDRVAQILREELGPTVDKIRDAVLKIEERVQAVNNSIEALNALPGIQLSTLDLQLEGPKEKIDLVVDSVQQLEQSVADFKSGIVQSLAPFREKVDRIAGFLARLDEEVKTYLDQVNKLQAAVASAQTNIPALIDRISLGLSLVFLWIIIAQVSLVLAARFYLQTGQAVWKYNSPKQTTQALPEAGD